MDLKSIYETHKNKVFKLAFYYTQQIEDAEEIMQDVFVKVHYHMEKFRGEAKLETWIYKITLNTCYDYLRAKKRKKFLNIFSNETLLINKPIAKSSEPDTQIESKEALYSLMNKLNKLNENEKRVIILLKLEDKSQHEVAELLDLSVKAVDSLYQRAKKKLEKILNETKDRN